jgi:transcriptional regulator with XRE-family HTH domain
MRINWHGAPARKPESTERGHLAAYVGKRLHELRQEHQVSMRSLANGTGLSNAFICQVENGQSVPSIDTLWRIAKYFDVSVGWFIDDYDPKSD